MKEEHSIKNLLFNNYKEKLIAGGSESVYKYVCAEYDVYSFSDCRDHYGATPKDRLDAHEENYQAIVTLLDHKQSIVSI